MKTIEYKGYTAVITIHPDEDHGAPWEQNDGHGIVTDWTTRDKRAGELLLHQDRGSKRFYDLAATLKLAKRDGWGLGEEGKKKLAEKFGRPPTPREIIAAAVQHDYEYLRGWCNDEWYYQGYTTKIESPYGTVTDGDSCWGYESLAESEEYMLGEAETSARMFIDRLVNIEEQTQIAECCP